MALRQVAARRRRYARRAADAFVEEMENRTPMEAFLEIATEHAPERQPDQEPLVPVPKAGEIKVRLGPSTKLTLADPSDSWGEDPDLGRIARDEAEPPLERKG